MLYSISFSAFVSFISLLFFKLYVSPRLNPLRTLSGPPVRRLFGSHLSLVLDPATSPKIHEKFVEKYGRSVRIRGWGPSDERLLALDPISVAHVLKNYTIYEKPLLSRKLITNMIGCGMLSAEGQVYKRQRRVVTPAFSVQNLRALVPLVFQKGNELNNKWLELVLRDNNNGIILDVYHWVSRATFDVIGSAGFDYQFNAIQNESDELFCAYRDMFEMSLSQTSSLLTIQFPPLTTLFPNRATLTWKRCQEVIQRVAGKLIQEKKRKLMESEKTGSSYDGKDLLTLLLKSNLAVDLPQESRISDEDILHNVNTFMFAGSDTSSLSVTWTLLLLAQHPEIQTCLREELLTVPNVPSTMTDDEVQSMYETIASLPFLHNVVRESLRVIPPVHSSIRVAMQDDVIPTKYPVHRRDGTTDEAGIKVEKGSVVHIAIEAFNLDKTVWGEDAWEFNPDRWDNLPEFVLQQPGLFSNILSFSTGPRACVGMRMAITEVKWFLYILLTNFVFAETDSKIIKANVVLTRPYISGRFKDGSQCPLRIMPFVRHGDV